jgi:hypothetical protein
LGNLSGIYFTKVNGVVVFIKIKLLDSFDPSKTKILEIYEKPSVDLAFLPFPALQRTWQSFHHKTKQRLYSGQGNKKEDFHYSVSNPLSITL